MWKCCLVAKLVACNSRLVLQHTNPFAPEDTINNAVWYTCIMPEGEGRAAFL